jgi:hypothetical protein
VSSTATQAALAAIDGLTFADCTVFFAAKRDDYALKFVEAARNQMHRDGEVEIDELAIISESGDGGEYVLAWVWVSNEDAGLETDSEEGGAP